MEIGWECIPLAVETYGDWNKKAHAGNVQPTGSRRFSLGTRRSGPQTTGG